MATIRGREVVWGVPNAAKTAVHTVTGSGIIQSVTVSGQANKEEITEEEGDYCTVVTHGHKSDLSIEVICEPDTNKPVAGDVLDGDLSALGIIGGLVHVDNADENWSNASSKKLTVKATHYPEMSAGV